MLCVLGRQPVLCCEAVVVCWWMHQYRVVNQDIDDRTLYVEGSVNTRTDRKLLGYEN